MCPITGRVVVASARRADRRDRALGDEVRLVPPAVDTARFRPAEKVRGRPLARHQRDPEPSFGHLPPDFASAS